MSGPAPELTDASLLEFVLVRARTWRAVGGAPRMRDADHLTGRLLPSGALDGLAELVDGGRIDASDRHDRDFARDCLVDAALETGSSWYAGGAAPGAWRPWFGVAALGQLLGGRVDEVIWSAVLGGEPDALAHLPHRPPGTRQPASIALWNLVGGTPPAVVEGDGWEEDACRTLLRSIPAGDHPSTAAALGELADHWIAETDDWNTHLPGYSIQFEVVEPALAAVAVGRGFDPGLLTPEQRLLLGPGLAGAAPEPLLGRVFTLAPGPPPGR